MSTLIVQDGAGTVVTADAGGLAINGSGVATGPLLIANVTINGFPSHIPTLATGLGVQVQTTTTEHTYSSIN